MSRSMPLSTSVSSYFLWMSRALRRAMGCSVGAAQ
jgi:hypothetical protein